MAQAVSNQRPRPTILSKETKKKLRPFPLTIRVLEVKEKFDEKKYLPKHPEDEMWDADPLTRKLLKELEPPGCGILIGDDLNALWGGKSILSDNTSEAN